MRSRSTISSERAAADYGVKSMHEILENGERRFRLTSPTGSGYILTHAGGGWQKSHHHKQLNETYIVEYGWMACAKFASDRSRIDILVLRPGDVTTICAMTTHNVYLPLGSIIHTVKHGSQTVADWIAEPALDELTRVISEEEILRLHCEWHA